MCLLLIQTYIISFASLLFSIIFQNCKLYSLFYLIISPLSAYISDLMTDFLVMILLRCKMLEYLAYTWNNCLSLLLFIGILGTKMSIHIFIIYFRDTIFILFLSYVFDTRIVLFCVFLKIYFIFELVYVNNARRFHREKSIHACNILWTKSPLLYIPICPSHFPLFQTMFGGFH
jgi:hypothetical protein